MALQQQPPRPEAPRRGLEGRGLSGRSPGHIAPRRLDRPSRLAGARASGRGGWLCSNNPLVLRRPEGGLEGRWLSGRSPRTHCSAQAGSSFEARWRSRLRTRGVALQQQPPRPEAPRRGLEGRGLSGRSCRTHRAAQAGSSFEARWRSRLRTRAVVCSNNPLVLRRPEGASKDVGCLDALPYTSRRAGWIVLRGSLALAPQDEGVALQQQPPRPEAPRRGLEGRGLSGRSCRTHRAAQAGSSFEARWRSRLRTRGVDVAEATTVAPSRFGTKGLLLQTHDPRPEAPRRGLEGRSFRTACPRPPSQRTQPPPIRAEQMQVARRSAERHHVADVGHLASAQLRDHRRALRRAGVRV